MVVPKTLSRNIQRIRKQKGITQEELAEEVRLSSTYIGFIEQGRASPSLKTVQKIANVLKVPISELFKK